MADRAVAADLWTALLGSSMGEAGEGDSCWEGQDGVPQAGGGSPVLWSCFSSLGYSVVGRSGAAVEGWPARERKKMVSSRGYWGTAVRREKKNQIGGGGWFAGEPKKEEETAVGGGEDIDRRMAGLRQMKM